MRLNLISRRWGLPVFSTNLTAVFQIVAVGSSLGTAATLYIASTRPLKAVVLQGSFMSAFRVVCPFKRQVSENDQYTNLERIRNVQVPTLFVHGRKDEYFCIRHAKILRRSCPGAAEVEPLYMDECGHLDFDDKIPYWQRLHTFMHRELVILFWILSVVPELFSSWIFSFLNFTNSLFCSSCPSWMRKGCAAVTVR